MGIVPSNQTFPKRVTRLNDWMRERDLHYALPLWLFSRVWVSFWAAVAVMVIPPLAQSVQNQYYGAVPLSGGLNKILWAPWQRWDTIWYTRIAEQGYTPNDYSSAFFPLYPIFIKFIRVFFGGNSVAAGVLVASIAALLSFILLYKLVRNEFGEVVARRTLICLAVFPTTFFFFAAYADSLFLSLVLGGFLAARAKHWRLAGILGGLAGLTKPQGMLLVLPLGVEFLCQYRRAEVSLSRAGNLPLTLLGGSTFWIYLWVEFGNPFAGLNIQSVWRQAKMPWEAITVGVARLWVPDGDVQGFWGLPDLAITCLFLGLGVWSIYRLSPTWSTYMAIVLIPPLSGITTYNTLLPLASMSRYVLLAFPGFILLSRIKMSETWQLLVCAFGLVLQTFWLILFVSWVFVG